MASYSSGFYILRVAYKTTESRKAVFIAIFFKYMDIKNVNLSTFLIMFVHQCRMGFWPRLFLLFCLGFRTEAYWGEAKRYDFWPRVLTGTIKRFFCLG